MTRLPFREIATASPLAMPRNDTTCVAPSKTSYRITMAGYLYGNDTKQHNNIVFFIKLSKGHSCYIITSAIIKNKCIKVR